MISTAAAIPKPLTNETEKSTMLQMVTQWLQRWHKEWPRPLRWLTVLHSRWRPAAFPATGACTLRKWELYTITLEEWHQNMMYSNGICFSSAFLKTLHCIKHIKYLLMPGRKVSEKLLFKYKKAKPPRLKQQGSGHWWLLVLHVLTQRRGWVSFIYSVTHTWVSLRPLSKL